MKMSKTLIGENMFPSLFFSVFLAHEQPGRDGNLEFSDCSLSNKYYEK